MIRYLLLISFFVGTLQLLAQKRTLSRKVSCNKTQTLCIMDSQRVTIGDRIGFFNSRGLLIAYGEVKSIRRGKRVVAIEKSYELISRNFTVDILENSISSYDTPALIADRRVDIAIGIGNYNFFGRTTTYELMGSYEWHKKIWKFNLPKSLGISVGGLFSTGSKNVGNQDLPFSISAFGLLAGASYTFFETYTMAVRTHAQAGGAFVSADVNGDENYKDNPLLNIKVDPGFKLLASAKIAAVYNMGRWNPQGGFYVTALDRSIGSTIFVGILAAF